MTRGTQRGKGKDLGSCWKTQECQECRDRREQETSGNEDEEEWRQKVGKRREREQGTTRCYLGGI